MVQKYFQLATTQKVLEMHAAKESEGGDGDGNGDDIEGYKEYLHSKGNSPYPGHPISTGPWTSREKKPPVVPKYSHIPYPPGAKRKPGRIPKIYARRTPNSYNVYCNEQREAVQLLNPGIEFGALGKLLGTQWKALDETSKDVS